MLTMNTEVQISKKISNKVANLLSYFKHFHDLVYLIICVLFIDSSYFNQATHNSLERYDLFCCLRNILNWIILSSNTYFKK